MNRNEEVDRFLDTLAHPLTEEINQVREIILSCHPGISEVIKWKSPTFIYRGNMASFFLNAKKHVSLMFHKGALLDDPTGLLQGDGKEGRTAKFSGTDDIKNKKGDLETVVGLWVTLQDDTT